MDELKKIGNKYTCTSAVIITAFKKTPNLQLGDELNADMSSSFRRGNRGLKSAEDVIKDNKILLGLRHYTPDKWKNVSAWTTPGGRCDEGETIGDNLRRETLEETGITDLEILNFLGKVPGAKEGDILYVFECSTNEEPKLMEPQKFSEWKWFNLNKIPKEFINPRILTLIK